MRAAATATMLAPVTTQDRLDIVPERVLDPLRRKPLAARLGLAFGDGLLSFVLNAAVVAWLVQLGWPLRPNAPDPISVEIVDHVPGDPTAAPDGQKVGASPKGVEMPDVVPKPSTEPATPETAQASEPVAKPQAEAPAQEPAAEPRPEPSAVPSKPEANPGTPPQTAAVPPPPEHPEDEARPQLVEAPKPPGRSATLSDTNTPAVPAPPEPVEMKPAPAEPQPRQPGVLSSPAADEILPVATPADEKPPEKPPEPTAEQKRQAETTARLAAVLPLSQTIMADPFQSRRNGQGATATSEAYRGAVYGAFAKANAVVEDARAKHLRGQAVVAFTLDDRGGLATLAIAVSSGHPEVDQAALELIRRSAPFPAPPAGAQRSFSPAIGFGLDE